MLINLDDATTVEKVALSAILDTRVLGLKAAVILSKVFGGTATGSANTAQTYIDTQDRVWMTGTGTYPTCFVKSKCKGAGRKGKEVKIPDAYGGIRLEILENNAINVEYYTIQDIQNSLTK